MKGVSAMAISEPTAVFSIHDDKDQEIKQVVQIVYSALEEKGYEVVNTLFTGEYFKYDRMKEGGILHRPLYFLAKSLAAMSCCDAVYFCSGWVDARGCRIEHEAAKAYGLEIIYEGE